MIEQFDGKRVRALKDIHWAAQWVEAGRVGTLYCKHGNLIVVWTKKRNRKGYYCKMGTFTLQDMDIL